MDAHLTDSANGEMAFGQFAIDFTQPAAAELLDYLAVKMLITNLVRLQTLKKHSQRFPRACLLYQRSATTRAFEHVRIDPLNLKGIKQLPVLLREEI